jgi:hypothetical protein
VTTLLNKAKENGSGPAVSEAELQKLREAVATQGDKVKEAKAVSMRGDKPLRNCGRPCGQQQTL